MLDQLLGNFSYDFVRNAFYAGSIAAILGAVVGYFVIIRNVGFAAHALAHIGFTGATGAALFGRFLMRLGGPRPESEPEVPSRAA